MANTCETFNINPQAVAHLLKLGYRSVTLLSMARKDALKNFKGNFEIRKCIKALEDRLYTPLEPLHSIRRLLYETRKSAQITIDEAIRYECLDYLDLAAKFKIHPDQKTFLKQLKVIFSSLSFISSLTSFNGF